MKALVLADVNQPLVLQEVTDPTAGPGEAVVRIKAAALNHRDLWIQKGQYAGLKFPIILGSDGCGVVESVGEGADGSWVGREVIMNPGLEWGTRKEVQADAFRILGLPDDGTFAEKVKVPASALVDRPAHLDAPQAAALPLAGLTAYRALFSRAGLRGGERVLITGAGGGAALFALQIAVAAGATVFVTSGSEDKIKRAVELGAAGGVNYKADKWADQLKEQAGGGFDVTIDSAGGPGFLQLVELATPGGRIAFFGATAGDPAKFPMRRVFWKQLSILGSTMGSPGDFAAMTSFIADKKLVPLASHAFPLAEGNAALEAMEKADQFGKIVLSVA